MKLFQSKPMNHVLHLLACVFLCGLWLPVWILATLTNKPEWHCSSCGFYDEEEYLVEPGRREAERRAAQIAAAKRQQEREDRSGLTVSERAVNFLSDNKAMAIGGAFVAIFVAGLFIAVRFDNAGKPNRIAVPSPTPSVPSPTPSPSPKKRR